jgi:hypothetical protein
MKRTLALAAVMAAVALATAPSCAAPLTTLPAAGAQAATGAVTHVQWGGRCRFWLNECANRWPGLGWRFRRCLAIRDCGGW